MKKITITKVSGQTGIISLAADGKYNITIDGQTNSAAHYTANQLDRIIDQAIADGSKVEVER